MADERFLVTGGTGCIGSWVVRGLVREGVPVTVVTTGRRMDRLRLILSAAELACGQRGHVGRQRPRGDRARGRDARITTIVHLAALQLPLCAADPVGGARVNVQGTASMFELARRLDIGRVTFASSAAVYGPKDALPGRGRGAGRGAVPHLALRRVQGRERAGGAGLLGDTAASRRSGCGPTPPTGRAGTRA